MLTLYKYITASLAFAGSLGLLITGELNPVFVLPGIMMVPGYYRYVNGKPPISRWLVAGLAVLELLVLAFDIMFVSSDFLLAIAHMTIVFQALKSFDMREPWDPLQVYFMSILQLIIISELSLSILVGVFFVFFLILFMAAMVFSHFMKEGTLHKVRFFKPVVVITLGALLLSLVMFVSIPRVSGGLWGRKASHGLRSVGFSGNVELGSYGKVLEDPSIVIRAEIEGPELPLYWRGSTLDTFDGARWRNSIQRRERIYKRKGRFSILTPRVSNDNELSKQRIIIEPLDTDILFGLGEIQSIEAKGWVLYTNYAGSVFLGGKDDRRISYTVLSLPDKGHRDVKYPLAHLQLPEGTEKVRKLAETVTEGLTTDYEKVMSIMSYLKSGFTYTLSPPNPPEDVAPIEWFLFESRQGYCEHFSTAMALMLRAIAVPSRIVTGFLGGEVNEFGNYIIVRQRNAHSWVEAAIDGKWVRFDPTPVSRATEASTFLMAMDDLRMKWYRYVIGFSRFDQISMLSKITVPFFETPDIRGLRVSVSPLYVMGFVVAILAILMFVFRGVPSGKSLGYSTRAYMVFRRELRKKGGRINDSSTPEDIVSEALRLKADPEKVSTITRLYLSSRFGNERLSSKDREQLMIFSKRPFR